MARSFDQLMANLAQLEGVPSRVATAFSEDVNKRLADVFEYGKDPYGHDFERNAASTVRKKGFDQPMVETGETARETRAYPTQGAGIEIRSTEKAGYNMEARDNVPARPVLPDGEDLPKTWQDDLQRRIDVEMRRALKR